MTSTLPARLRGFVAIVATLLVASLLPVVLASPGHAAESSTPTARVTWSVADGADIVATTPASVTVALADGVNETHHVDWYSVLPGNGGRSGDIVLNAKRRSVTITLPTHKVGPVRFHLEVLADESDLYLVEDRRYRVVEPARAATQMTVKWPKTRVKRDSKQFVTGTVSGGARAVVLEHKGALGWRRMTTTTSTATGKYRLRIPTHYPATHRLRVTAPQTYTHVGRVLGGKRRVTVPTPKAAGRAQSHRFMERGVRWNPCKTIRVRINPARAPKGGVADARRALRMTAQASGLRFKIVGKSKQIPYRGFGSRNYGFGTPPRKADLLIGWATPAQVPALAGITAGYGGNFYTGPNPKIAHSGLVVIESPRTWPGANKTGFKKGALHSSVMLHEIGHAIGLDHVEDRSQVMHHSAHADTSVRWGAGDLAGLRRLGAAQGCIGAKQTYSTTKSIG